MIKIDLHTHSAASSDGGISLDSYKKIIKNKELDYIAITDHNRIDFAQEAKEILGENIIVGEEIMTQSGEIIGLYLKELIPKNLPLIETIELIKSQNGLVYIPHPMEKVRKGISKIDLEKIVNNIDIIEVINGRAFLGKKTSIAGEFAHQHLLTGCASSDSHGKNDWGRTYSVLKQKPTRDTLVKLLSNNDFYYKKPTIRAILYPKYNKLKKVLL